MIEPGDGYKFRNHLFDYGLFEDQVLEHMLVGHLVARRAFSPKLQEDAAAFDAVKKQAEASATVDHWGYPALYMSEVVDGHYCLYMEYIDGETLETLTQRKAFEESAVWAEYAMNLVKLLQDFDERKIAFDQLLLKNIVSRGRLMRVANRWPVSPTKSLDESRWMQRLKSAAPGGVYVAEGAYPAMECVARLKDLLFQMATGQTTKTVAQALEALQIKEKEIGIKAFSQLQLDQPIEQILLRMHNLNHARAIRTLEELKGDLVRLCPSRTLVSRTSDTASPRRRQSAETPIAAAPTATQPEPAAAPAAVTAPPAHESRSSKTLEMVGHHRMDEDAEEDRTYLYPGAEGGSGSGTQTPLASALHQAPGASKPAKSRRPISVTKLMKLLVGMLIATVIILGSYLAYLSLLVEKPNQVPTAEFMAIPSQIRAWEKIKLDASPSFDPEASELSYTWDIKGLGATDYRIEPNKSRAARTPTLEFFSSGSFTIELRVFDGRNYSAAATQQIEVMQVEKMR